MIDANATTGKDKTEDRPAYLAMRQAAHDVLDQLFPTKREVASDDDYYRIYGQPVNTGYTL